MVPNNQEAYKIGIARQLEDKKKLLADATRKLEKQRREFLKQEIELREEVANMIDSEVDKRISSDEIKKKIEMTATQRLAIKRSHENTEKIGKTRLKNTIADEADRKIVENEIARRIKFEEQKAKENTVKQRYLPLIEKEVRKVMTTKQERVHYEASMHKEELQPSKLQSRGGQYKSARDQ